MKKILIALIVTASLINAAHSQTTVLAKDVPVAVQQKMNKMFPSATSPEWKQDVPGFITVDFMDGKKKMAATFIGSGGWVSTSTYLNKEEYPKAVTDYITANFSGAKIKNCDISETVKEKTYECLIKYNGDQYEVVFDMDGKFKMKSKVED